MFKPAVKPPLEKDDKMEMKLFVRDWLYHHSPAFRENDEEFIAKLEEYRKEMFRKTVEISRRRPQKNEPKPNIKDRFSRTLKLPEMNWNFQIPRVEQKRWKKENEKYIPVIVTDLLHSQQKKRIMFRKDKKIDSVVNVGAAESTKIDTKEMASQDLSAYDVDDVDREKSDEEKEEEKQTSENMGKNESSQAKKRKRKGSMIWLLNARKLRALLKILAVHKNDGLSELLKFLKRHHITNNFTVTKLHAAEQCSAEKVIVEHLQNVQQDLKNLLESSKCLAHSRKVRRQKLRRRILEITDTIRSILQSCLISATSGTSLDPINLYSRIHRIEMMYTTLYRDDILTLLRESPSLEKKKKIIVKRQKCIRKEKEKQLTGSPFPSNTPGKVIRECKSDLICTPKRKLKPSLNVSLSMPTIETLSYPSLLSSSSKQLEKFVIDEEAVDSLMINIENMVTQKLNSVLDTDSIVGKKTSEMQPSKKTVRIEELNKALSIEEKPTLKESNEVDSLIETWDSIVIAKEKLQGPDLEDWTKPNFNERLPKAEDSLVVISKKLNVPLKFHSVAPRVRTPYESKMELSLNVSRTCAHLDLLNMDTAADEIMKPSILPQSNGANEIKPLDIIKRPSKMVLKSRKDMGVKKRFHQNPTWVP